MRLEADSLPKEQRGVRSFQRLIAAMRACEAEVMENYRKCQDELFEALKGKQALQDRVHSLEGQLLKQRIRDAAGEIEALTSADRVKLLTAATVDGGSGRGK